MDDNSNNNDLIFGLDKTDRIVSVEPSGDELIIFRELEDGTVSEEKTGLDFWFLTHTQVSSKQMELDGNQHFKYMATFPTVQEKEEARQKVYKSGYPKENVYSVYDRKEQSLLRLGMTYFKGMKSPSEVSVLSFDIETSGLAKNDDSMIYLITNTYRKLGEITQKTFSLEHYENVAFMIDDWCNWVRDINPSIMIGHNIYMYDLPFLDYVAKLYGTELFLGRDGSAIRFNNYSSKFRKDGSQSYDYNKCYVYGREIADSLFFCIHYDIGRNFESYGLKAVVKHLGLEKKNRSFVDAGKIRLYFENREENPEMWERTKTYACFAENSSLVSMADGSVKLIENVLNGDQVITHDGSEQYVYRTLKKEYQGSVYNFDLEGGRKIHKATEEHPFYVFDENINEYKWVKAKDLKINQLLVKGHSNNLIEKDNGNYDLDEIYLFGFFQGDGYVRIQDSQVYPVFTIHQDEVTTITNLLDLRNLKYSIVEKKLSKGVDIVVINSRLGNKYLNWGGGKFKSYDKKVSKDFFSIINSKKRYFMAFLAGMCDSDGHVRKMKEQGEAYQLSLKLTSPHLINAIDLCSNKHQLNVNRTNFRFYTKKKPGKIKGREIISKRQTFELVFFTDSLKTINPFLKIKKTEIIGDANFSHVKLVRIRKIDKQEYSGFVYNISVTNTNTFISNGIITHNCDDSEDPIKLFDLMIPAKFFFSQSVSKSFQEMCTSATGSQINNMMVRSYLQVGHSIAKADIAYDYQGAVSLGVPGFYTNVVRFDCASMYPSIIREYKIHSKLKDPQQNILKLTEYFAVERLKNKKLAKETGLQYYKDSEQSQKVAINSIFGFMSASGLNYNYIPGSAEITRRGRELLGKVIEWATGEKFEDWHSRSKPQEASIE